MTIQPHEITPAIIGPPQPVLLDGIAFVSAGPEAEGAWLDGNLIGELHHDDERDHWAARFGDGEFRPMRCRAEARAFIVAAHRGRAGLWTGRVAT